VGLVLLQAGAGLGNVEAKQFHGESLGWKEDQAG
jgi:hypothetical protein